MSILFWYHSSIFHFWTVINGRLNKATTALNLFIFNHHYEKKWCIWSNRGSPRLLWFVQSWFHWIKGVQHIPFYRRSQSTWSILWDVGQQLFSWVNGKFSFMKLFSQHVIFYTENHMPIYTVNKCLNVICSTGSVQLVCSACCCSVMLTVTEFLVISWIGMP